MFTTWYAASEEDVEALLDEELSTSVLHLDRVGELELLALGEVLGVEYAPRLLREEPVVLRVDPGFLRALADASRPVAVVAAAWRARAEHLADRTDGEVEEVLSSMRSFVAAARLGVLSRPF